MCRSLYRAPGPILFPRSAWVGGEETTAPAESQNLLFPELKGSPGDFVGMQEGKWE